MESYDKLTRRGLLQAAGGVTFLALAPAANALLEAPAFEPTVRLNGNEAPPLFTAVPYIQPGPDASKLIDGQESVVIAWQTNAVHAEYEVKYGKGILDQTATVASGGRRVGDKGETDSRLNYHAQLTGLKLGTRYRYQVTMNGHLLLEGYFTTRKPRGAKVRFVSFGDNSYGEISDRQIAFQTYQAKPDFVMNTGDNVYESGLDSEYARFFFPIYNADVAGPRIGAPLLRSVPFYTVIANHDVHGKDGHKHPVADFDKFLDPLGYYSAMHLPLNGPAAGPYPTPLAGNPAAIDSFKKLAGRRYPAMNNYSFDYGDVHFTCLDSNVYVDPTDPALQAWIENDLASTDAIWKIVVYHHPAFNVGDEHYHEQQMRVLCPLMERHGVDFVLSGHEHTYQRTKPLKFAPKDVSGADAIGSGTRFVPGDFTVDTEFDGKTKTKPNGILHITTGAGGKHLYDPEQNDNPKNWTLEEDGHVAYVDRFISDRHSLSVFDVDGKRLTMKQVDEWGRVVDRITVTK